MGFAGICGNYVMTHPNILKLIAYTALQKYQLKFAGYRFPSLFSGITFQKNIKPPITKPAF
jgi:hypothetical protein